jgi:hypothetical protein
MLIIKLVINGRRVKTGIAPEEKENHALFSPNQGMQEVRRRPVD